MFVQISPSAADLGETLCSLNFASRVRGIECGPVRKQADLTEIFKYKQLVCENKKNFSKIILCSFKLGWTSGLIYEQAEKLKHDEKETKKLQDNLQSLQLKLAAREHICRSVQEKVTTHFSPSRMASEIQQKNLRS